MALAFKEMDACVSVLTGLIETVPADRITLSSPCRHFEEMRLISFTATETATPEIVSVPNHDARLCKTVVARNAIVNLSQIRRRPGETRDLMLRSEKLCAYLGVPVQDPDGEAVACLSLSCRMARIWSRKEQEKLIFAATVLRTMMFNAPDHSWHEALHHGTRR